MAIPRPLLIPWLQEQISSGQYPGLHWTNKERTQFCIPWKHGLRQDSSSDDILIFKAWAEISGAYVPGQTPDPSVWKRNFRSALRVKGFKIIRDNKNNTDNPHKVYELPEGDRHGSTVETAVRKRRGKKDMVLSRTESLGSQETGGCPSPQQINFINHEHMYLPEHATVYSPSEGAFCADHDQLQEILKDLNITEDQTSPHAAEQIVEPRGGCFDEDIETGNDQQRVVEEFKETMSRTVVDDSLSTTFKVSVYYRGVRVLEQIVEEGAGFKVLFRPDQMFGCDSNLELVILPSPEQVPIHDQKQVELTRRILDKMGAGLEVIVQGSAILARRHGDSRVYWSLCKHDRNDIPRKVGREYNTVYTLREFIAGLMEFMKKGGQSPSYSLFFCLGEIWPDPSQKPWEKKLIMVEVVFTSLELLKMIAVNGGASSLQSVDLQFSDTPRLLDALEEMMDFY